MHPKSVGLTTVTTLLLPWLFIQHFNGVKFQPQLCFVFAVFKLILTPFGQKMTKGKQSISESVCQTTEHLQPKYISTNPQMHFNSTFLYVSLSVLMLWFGLGKEKKKAKEVQDDNSSPTSFVVFLCTTRHIFSHLMPWNEKLGSWPDEPILRRCSQVIQNFIETSENQLNEETPGHNQIEDGWEVSDSDENWMSTGNVDAIGFFLIMCSSSSSSSSFSSMETVCCFLDSGASPSLYQWVFVCLQFCYFHRDTNRI